MQRRWARGYAQAQGRPLVMIWDKHVACPGSFRDLFLPIDGCVVVDSLSELSQLRANWRHLARIPPDTITSTAFTHPEVEGTPVEAAMWAPLNPNAAIQAQVEERSAALGRGSFIACHVRRTDVIPPGLKP